MPKNPEKRSELHAAVGREFRQFSLATILFHQAIADRLGVHVTDHKCAELLLLGGPMTAGELAQRTGLTTGAVTGVIDRLEKAGLVRRVKDTGDRRRVVIEPFAERIEKEIAGLFGPIGRAMADLCSQFSTGDLDVIRDFTARFHAIVDKETWKLREEGRQPARAPLRSPAPTPTIAPSSR